MMNIGSTEALGFQIDWIPVGEGQGLSPAEAATWARVAIFAGGRNLTENVDAGEQYGEAIFVSPLPLCFWIAEQWNEIFGAERRPQENGADNPFLYLAEAASGVPDESNEADELFEQLRQWWNSHSLRAARFGEAIPDVVLWRQGTDVVVSWTSDKDPFGAANIRFVAQPGSTNVRAKVVANTCLELMGVIEERLNSQGVTREDDPLADRFFSAHESLRSETSRFGLIVSESALPVELFSVASGIGLEAVEEILRGRDPLAEEWEQVLRSFRIRSNYSVATPQEIADGSEVLALFRSASPNLTRDDVISLTELIESAAASPVDNLPIEELRRRLPPIEEDGLPGYRRGQIQARTARDQLDLGSQPVDVEEILSNLIGSAVRECRLSDRTIDAVSLWSEQIPPTVAVNDRAFMGSTPWGRRMAIAHEFCHLLFDTAEGKPLGIASGEAAPVTLEKVANAFAAEFLLPRQAITSSAFDVKTDSGFTSLMDTYEVGATVAAHQLANHGFISHAHRDYYLRCFGQHYQ